MIAKQVANRHDGKSDFGDLAKYLTGGMGREELAAFALEQPGFGKLSSYVAQKTNAAGKDKCIAVALNGIASVATAALEFHAVSSRNFRVTNPVVHLLVSWPEHERPSIESVFDAGRDVLLSLGLQEHQYLMAIHDDTDNLHCHIEVNRVHPVTFKSNDLAWAHKTMAKASREIEIKNGWSHDNGLFVVRELPDGRKFVVPNDQFEDTAAIEHRTTAPISTVNAWSDQRSLVDHCRDNVTPELMTAMVSESATWTTVHAVLSRHGMRVEKTGDDAFRLEALSEVGEIVRLPISKALRAIKFSEAESLLGPFKASRDALKPPSVVRGVPASEQLNPKPTKRDPAKREARRLERAAERTELINRYKADQIRTKADREQHKQQLATIANWKRTELAKLKTVMSERRAAIRSLHLDPSSRKAQYSLLALSRFAQTSQIAAEAETRKAVVVAQRAAPLAWRTWLEQEAQKGDHAALAALRGIVYQKGRDANKDARAGQPSDEEDADAAAVLAALSAREQAEDALWSDKPNQIRAHAAEALMREVHGLKWKVTNNGNVEYQRQNGQAVYVDRGNKITFDRKTVTDQDLALALFHAREKWGKGIVLTAGDGAFTARMVKAAVAAGITVKNPELQQMQAFFKTQQNGKRPVPKSRARTEEPATVVVQPVSPTDDVLNPVAGTSKVGPTPVKPTVKVKRARR